MADKETYLQWLREFATKPVVGEHTVGELRIVCSHKNWFMTDRHGNRWEGKKDPRTGINRAILQYLKVI